MLILYFIWTLSLFILKIVSTIKFNENQFIKQHKSSITMIKFIWKQLQSMYQIFITLLLLQNTQQLLNYCDVNVL